MPISSSSVASSHLKALVEASQIYSDTFKTFNSTYPELRKPVDIISICFTHQQYI